MTTEEQQRELARQAEQIRQENEERQRAALQQAFADQQRGVPSAPRSL